MSTPGILGPTVDLLHVPVIGQINALQILAGVAVLGLTAAVAQRIYKTVAGTA